MHNPVSIEGRDLLRPHYRLDDRPPQGPGYVRVIRDGKVYLYSIYDLAQRTENIAAKRLGKRVGGVR